MRCIGTIPAVVNRLVHVLSASKVYCSAGKTGDSLIVFLYDPSKVDQVPMEFESVPVRVFDLAENELRERQ